MNSETHITDSVDLGEFLEAYLPEDDIVADARLRGEQLGCLPVSCAAGSALSFLTASVQAKAVVEIGTGAGVSGLYLLRGMTPEGVLTSIDLEPEFHRSARTAFSEAGFTGGRTRLIMGRALDVLPRLTTGGYDLVFADATRLEYPQYFEQAVELLRPGGVIAFHSVLAVGGIADPSRREPELLALRDVARAVRDDHRLVPTLLPLGSGLLVAAVATP